MRSNFAFFNFQSPDLVAEDKNYRDHHVALAMQFPRTREYFTGKLRPSRPGEAPAHYRIASVSFDTEADFLNALHNSPQTELLRKDTEAHLKDLRWIDLESEAIVPLAPRVRGSEYFMLASEFDFKADRGDLAAAEKHYLDYHVQLARKLPGLRAYRIARQLETDRCKPDRMRMAILVFDNEAAFKAAFATPQGKELVADPTLTNGRMYQIDAQLEI